MKSYANRIAVASPLCPAPRKGGAPRTSKRKHRYGFDGHCTFCGVRKTWEGAKGPCPPKVRT